MNRAKLGKQSVLSFAGAITSAVLGFMLVLVLARGLGDADSGIVLQAIAVFMIALGFARFGMDSTAVWLLPRLLDDEPRRVRATAWFLILASGAAGLVCAGIVFVSAELITAQSSGAPLLAAVRAGIVFLPFLAMLLTALAVSRALGRIAEYVTIGSIGLPLARLLLVVALVALGTTTTYVAFAWAAPALVALAAALLLLPRQIRRVTAAVSSLPLRGSGIPARVIKFSLPRVVSAALEQMLVWLSVLIVGVTGGAAEAGVYGVAARLVAAGLVVDAALRVVVAPLFSRLHNRGDFEGVGTLHVTATTWLVLFSAPIFILIAVFSPVVLSVFGAEFVGGSTALTVMCVGVLTAFLAGNVQTILLTAGRSGLAAVNKAIVVVLNVALIPPFMAMWGVTGAAVAFTAACVTDALLAWAEIRWVLRLPVSLTAGLYALAVCTLSVALPAVTARLIWGATWPGLLVAAGVAVTAYLVCCVTRRQRLGLTMLTSQR
ncbi:oligosaccharide flippase family protein [Leucobacter sp. HY1908]